MTKVTVIQDLKTDASNRYEAINTCNYRSNRRKNARLEDLPIVNKITDKTRKEAYEILFPYLEEKYKINKSQISKKLKDTQRLINKYKNIIFEKIEKLTKFPLNYEEIKIFLTTYPRCPYNREKGFIRLFINAEKERILTILAHEILHFQFHKYYSNNPLIQNLNHQQFDTIKESLTFLLNHEFDGIPMAKDQGYDIHKNFREKLETFRINTEDKDFQKLIDYACSLFPSEVENSLNQPNNTKRKKS